MKSVYSLSNKVLRRRTTEEKRLEGAVRSEIIAEELNCLTCSQEKKVNSTLEFILLLQLLLHHCQVLLNSSIVS